MENLSTGYRIFGVNRAFQPGVGLVIGGCRKYVFSSVFRVELCEGFDYRWAEEVLVRYRLMKPGNDDRDEQRRENPYRTRSHVPAVIMFDQSSWEE
uniref:Uncharacterized protein n=1 Tax=Candidatus Kentrum sp. LPFa TaxID=2126335 RepID=A0A450VZH7_9GAMM|nr:MAG: hypothetical protein BECKLPF1236B_GA0070989_10132 [Candidatus Kentron sp. LPFa]